MLANSPVVISALVESLRHDPFYLAITEGTTQMKRGARKRSADTSTTR